MLRKAPLSLLGLTSLLLFIPCQARAQDEPQAPPANAARPVRIGMVDTLFTDVPPFLIGIGAQMFAQLMKTSTGMDGAMLPGGDPLTLAKSLDEGKVDLAVFHGVEFAWAQKQYPNLRPLMVAVTKYPHTQAHIIINKGCDISNFTELKGKIFCLPTRSRAHCVLFMERHCSECGQCRSRKFFGEVVKQCEEDALDSVCFGRIQATVIDAVSLETYESIHPGRFAKLKVLVASEHFPNGVIAYKDGTIAEDVLAKFRTGLLNSNKTSAGQELLQTFKITSFEEAPENYTQMLRDIIKIYPPPTVAAPK